MTEQSSGWAELFERSGFAVTIFLGGIALQALEVFIASAMLPTVVRDIGGIELFAWNTTLFIVASILASIFAAVRPASIGPRGAYMIAAGAFGLGSLICGIAPSMPVLLAGRFVQGFGAGLLIATTYAMIRIVFPQHLWSRAMALNSVVWGIATLLGPAVGGIFAQFDLWRWAFLGIVPLAALLALGAVRILPATEQDEAAGGAPLLQIALVTGAILAISTASLLTSNTPFAMLLLLAATAAIVALALVEDRASVRLMPVGSLRPTTPLGALFATTLLLGIAVTSDIFAPFFLQRLHGLPPLWAGYVAAFVAAGWTLAALLTSGWTGARPPRPYRFPGDPHGGHHRHAAVSGARQSRRRLAEPRPRSPLALCPRRRHRLGLSAPVDAHPRNHAGGRQQPRLRRPRHGASVRLRDRCSHRRRRGQRRRPA